MGTDLNNEDFQLALDFVNHTDRHVFLTGRAGSGKTTFLKHIREHSSKKLAVVAPTGVAAVNAGGVTIHSFLQIAPGTFLPDVLHGWNSQSQNILTRESLIRNIRLSPAKKEVLQELELLIIDEVSMVRADMMDAIDHVLRHVRNNSRIPFGGVQLLLIGDLFQLPPVVKPEDWEILKEHYESAYFFDSGALKEAPLVYLELKKIYRQTNTDFIHLLNAIRNNTASPDQLKTLNRYFDPAFRQPPGESFITLTTHNFKADLINREALSQLPGETIHFLADIQGEFPEKSYPAELRLSLKTGAQVMFIKNDKGESRRFYNGKLATISRIENTNKIFVRFAGENDEMEIEPESWRNIKYRYEKEKDKIEEEELGIFKQFPIRLAWAITIHKSQGLTFEKAIIDAGESFSPGQVYVALSRMTDLSGMVLRSRIIPQCIRTDERVVSFCQEQADVDTVKNDLTVLQGTFVKNTIINSFDLQKLLKSFQSHVISEEIFVSSADRQANDFFFMISESIDRQISISEKFSRELAYLLDSDKVNGYEKLYLRTQSAVQYFMKQINDWKRETEGESKKHTTRKKGRKYISMLRNFEKALKKQEYHLSQSLELTKSIKSGAPLEKMISIAESKPENQVTTSDNYDKSTMNGKEKKQSSASISLALFKSGLSVDQIAKERCLTSNTIFNHLTGYIPTGELNIHELLPESRVKTIIAALSENSLPGFRPVIEKLGNEFSYEEIRAVSTHLRRISPGEEKV